MTDWSLTNKKRAMLLRRGFANSRRRTHFMVPMVRAPRPVPVGPSKAEQRALAADAIEEWLQRHKGR